MLCMSKTSKMVFAAFMQHCMQSYSFCYSCRRCQRCQILWIIDQRLKIHTNIFLLITSFIFNGFSIWKKFWLRAFHSNPMYVKECRRCWRLFWPSMSSTCFNIHSIWWYGWKALSLSFPKLFIQILCMSKNVEDVEDYFDLQCLQHASTYIAFDDMVGKP